MGLFSRHIDARLVDWSAGELGPWRAQRMISHARACTRCRAMLDRVLLAHRVLEGSLLKPSEQELGLWSANAKAIAAASAPRAERSPAGGWLLAAAGVATACAVLAFVARPAPEPEWAARGDLKAQNASVRIFCAPAKGALAELQANQGCPAGNALGFAVGARPPLHRVRVLVTQAGKMLAHQETSVTAAPGAEDALALSVDMPATGQVRVEVCFAEAGGDFDRSTVRLVREIQVEAVR